MCSYYGLIFRVEFYLKEIEEEFENYFKIIERLEMKS